MEKRHPDADCHKCPLFKEGVGYVPGEGPTGARVAFVGEAPGQGEVATGRPFTGISGKLLDTVLAHYGVERSEVRISNAVLCRPAGNETPTARAVRACSPRLERELEGVETIVALGRVAADSLFGSAGKITERRVGPPKQSEKYPGARIIPTVHPAATLRVPDMFPLLVTDIGKLKVDTSPRFEEPVHRAFDDPLLAATALGQLLYSKYELIALDIEVGVEKDKSYTHPDDLLSVGLSYDADKAIVIGENALKDPDVRRLVGKIAQRKMILCHNGKFDLQTLYNLGIVKEPKLHADTMLASYALDERPGVHGLKYLAKELLGAPDYDQDITRYVGTRGSYSLVPRDVLYRYNAWDAALTFRLWQLLAPRLEAEGLRKTHDFLVTASNALTRVESGGVAVDQKYLSDLSDTYLDELERLEKLLALWVKNPRSPQQVAVALAEFGFKVTTTNEEMLKNLLARAGGDAKQFIQLMLEYRKEHKLYGTYIKGTAKRLLDGRVFPTFLLHGTTTGRLACRNPNLQNVPRDSSIRRLFVPGEGNVFIQADYKTIELRVVACESRDEWLGKIFRSGFDIHDEVAERFFGPNFTKDQRVRAKAVVYGLSYGREAYSLAMEYGMEYSEANRYVDMFFERIPEAAAWRESIKRRVLRENEVLQTKFGRKRRFWLITKETQKDVLKEAYAFTPQSVASDITLSSLIRLVDMGLDVRIPVHDSLLVECRVDDADDIARTTQEVMEQTAKEVYSDFVPFPVDVKVGRSWGDV